MTLWDKEDMAVRMVLEEGKLNMCLRVLQGAHSVDIQNAWAHARPRQVSARLVRVLLLAAS